MGEVSLYHIVVAYTVVAPLCASCSMKSLSAQSHMCVLVVAPSPEHDYHAGRSDGQYSIPQSSAMRRESACRAGSVFRAKSHL